MCLYATRWFCYPLKFSGDVQSETGQSNTTSSSSTRPHSPHQLPSFRLRLLARAGLRGTGDIRQVPATSCCVTIFRVCPRGSHHHRLQSHWTISWIQPVGTPPECEGTECGGDFIADVQDYRRSCPMTNSGLNLRFLEITGSRNSANWTAVCRWKSKRFKGPIVTAFVTLKYWLGFYRELYVKDFSCDQSFKMMF